LWPSEKDKKITFLQLINLFKKMFRDGDLVHFVEDGKKLKIHYEITPPLKIKMERLPNNFSWRKISNLRCTKIPKRDLVPQVNTVKINI
jgi:hypothetical protein